MCDRIRNCRNIYEKVKVLLNEVKISEVVYDIVQDDTKVVPDIALIQCFHGTDIARIRATATAIEFNLQMTRKPSTWIFVECQKSE